MLIACDVFVIFSTMQSLEQRFVIMNLQVLLSMHTTLPVCSIDGNAATSYQTFHVSGSLAVQAGQRVQIYTYRDNNAAYNIQHESGSVSHGRRRVSGWVV